MVTRERVAALIGDVVDSRHAPDRHSVHAHLVDALGASTVPSLDRPVLTVGDEFQGAYASLGLALDAAFRIRVTLLPDIDVRFGVGVGERQPLEPDWSIQDGPAWWRAREAIDTVAEQQKKAAYRHTRTVVIGAEADLNDLSATNAALLCRDYMLGSLDTRSTELLRGMMDSRPRKAMADELGVSPSAVSQRIAKDGIAVIISASEHLSRTP